MSFDKYDAYSMELIMDHYKNPHNKGKLAHPDLQNKEKNPSCGDEIEVTATLDAQQKIQEIKFDGHGCAISQASISILTDELKGKSFQEILKMKKEDVLELLGIDVAPLRVKCAMLGLRVLQRSILNHEGKDTQQISLSEI